jgi:hypothetical protein
VKEESMRLGSLEGFVCDEASEAGAGSYLYTWLAFSSLNWLTVSWLVNSTASTVQPS